MHSYSNATRDASSVNRALISFGFKYTRVFVLIYAEVMRLVFLHV